MTAEDYRAEAKRLRDAADRLWPLDDAREHLIHYRAELRDPREGDRDAGTLAEYALRSEPPLMGHLSWAASHAFNWPLLLGGAFCVGGG